MSETSLPSSLTRARLSQALAASACQNVAWAGSGGRDHYRIATNCNPELAVLAEVARDDFSLVQLVCGWWRAQNVIHEFPTETVVIIEDLEPKLLENLRQQQKQGLSLLLILVDEQRRYQSYWPWNSEVQRGSLEAYCSAYDLPCTPPVECLTLNDVRYWLEICRQQPGVRLLHLLGPLQTATPPQALYHPFNWKEFTPSPPRSMATFAESTIQRFLPDLRNLPQVLSLWAHCTHPGTLIQLGKRLQPCPSEGILLQALGLIGQGWHPLIFIATDDLPLLLAELPNYAEHPLTIVAISSEYRPGIPLDAQSCSHDLAMLRTLSQAVVAVPADEEEARAQLVTLLNLPRLGILRLPQTPALNIPRQTDPQVLEVGTGRTLRTGRDLALLCLGSVLYPAIIAAETLRSWGIETSIYDMRFLNPLDKNLLHQAQQKPHVITLEEHSVRGGFGTAVLEELVNATHGDLPTNHSLLKIGWDRNFSTDPLDAGSITIDGILQAAKQVMGMG